MKSTPLLLRSAAVAAAIGLSSAALAAVFPETEPNDGKFAANAVGPMLAGDSIVGNSTGTSTTVAGPASADNYLITLGATSPGIYRHRLVLTSNTPANVGSIRGLTQTAGAVNPGTDTAFQTSSTATSPPRFNQWYSFGGPSQLYYRVTGVATSTADYTATLETLPVAATPVGVLTQGQITFTTIGQGHTTDTDMWVYDGNFNAIDDCGNDDESIAGGGTGTTLQSLLKRNYAPGVYYIALSNFSFANEQDAAPDDDFVTGGVMDFPGVAANSSTTTNLNMAFTLSDTDGHSFGVANTKVGPYDVNWFSFEVVAVPEPSTLGLLALAAPAVLRRRRK